MSKKNNQKRWPANCIWPEPIPENEGFDWDPEDAFLFPADDEIEELLEFREYYDSLREEGCLNEDYSLNEEYELTEDNGLTEEFDTEAFVPAKGEDYWDDGFDIEAWEEDLTYHLNLLKITPCDIETDPVCFVRETIEYEFINENLLRQAFTRRAFSVEYGLHGCSEELEFLGDAVLNETVTRLIIRQLMGVNLLHTDAPFGASIPGCDEGTLTRIRSRYISKEHLSRRAAELGLDRYILYGTGEEPTESSREDMMEALLGAVAVDSGWDQRVLENAVDRLVCIQLTKPDQLLKTTFYDLFNAWHQKHFGCMPSYEMSGKGPFHCALRFQVPENENGIRPRQRVDIDAESRSNAREHAAELAYRFTVQNGLWINLKDAGLIPDVENSINQLQELYQKKYLETPPQYELEPWIGDEWNCDCICGGVSGFGRGIGKTKAKKKAAYMVLIRLLKAAGLCKEEWEREMWR